MNHARNLGLSNAKGGLVAYIDDDARADASWLEKTQQLFFTTDPKPDCMGGPIFPFYTSPKPVWFKDKYEVRRDWKSPRYLESGKSFSGSNMIWRKDVLDDLGGFDTHFGVTGNTLRLGGETIGFDNLWATKESAILLFSPELIVYHWVPENKMKSSYFLKRYFVIGQYQTPVQITKKIPEKKKFFKFLFLIFKRTLIALTKINSHNRWQNWVVEELSPISMLIGELLGSWGLFLRFKRI